MDLEKMCPRRVLDYLRHGFCFYRRFAGRAPHLLCLLSLICPANHDYSPPRRRLLELECDHQWNLLMNLATNRWTLALSRGPAWETSGKTQITQTDQDNHEDNYCQLEQQKHFVGTTTRAPGKGSAWSRLILEPTLDLWEPS